MTEPTPRTAARIGRPTDLTPEVIEDVVKVVSAGVPWAYTAATAKVSTRTIYGWMERGEREVNRLLDEPDVEPDENEALFAELFVRVEQAAQLAVQRSIMYIQSSARGGYVTETSTRKNRDGSVETTEKRTSPDWRAAHQYLKYADRRRFGDQPQQLEVTGAGGGPIAVEGLGGLAARLAAVRELENVVDAEEIEGDDND